MKNKYEIAINRFCKFWSIEKDTERPLRNFILENIIPKIKKEMIKEIQLMIATEINIANEHGQETSRLTALSNKIINK